jgi:serine protease Do
LTGRIGLAVLLATILAPTGAAQVAGPDAADGSAAIFGRYAARVVKIEVVERGSGAKASLGTGFFATAAGHLVTNYHVIAEVVHDPARYRARWLDQAGAGREARVVAIDVVSDLAVLATGSPAPAHFTLEPVALPHGSRLYSLGHPQDLGLSIVEGTYNGLLEHALYPKIHFTGPLNSGMSGGPALTARGQVVGVNVSTGGNSVSFLVPADRARALVARARTAPAGAEADLLDEAGAQLLEHQDRFLARLFGADAESVRLGPFAVPTRPAPFFRCWGDADRQAGALYDRVVHRCSTDDYVYLAADQSSGVVTLEHEFLSSERLHPARFYALYQTAFRFGGNGDFGEGGDVTARRCRAANLRQDGMTVRTVFCVTGYVDFPGLYDATLRAAVLGARDVGLVTTLSLAGVSFANAERLAREFLGRIRWAR